MKKIALALMIAAATVLAGCTSEKYCKVDTAETTSCTSKFNDTHYVWEELQFPTNRTSGVQ